eukprot:s913_g9.t1
MELCEVCIPLLYMMLASLLHSGAFTGNRDFFLHFRLESRSEYYDGMVGNSIAVAIEGTVLVGLQLLLLRLFGFSLWEFMGTVIRVDWSYYVFGMACCFIAWLAAPSEDCKAIVNEFWSGLGPAAKAALGLKLESLLAVWLLNCFEHSEDLDLGGEPVGFSTFFLPAFVSHDCRPNCMWHYEGDSFVMRARRDIPQGEEITVSYLAEESLLESTASRRSQLEATKHFLCNCATCSQALDPVRGFRCPGCRKGDLFLEMVMGSLQPSTQGACGVCGFLPTEAQAKEMIDQEARRCVQEWDRKVNNAATYLPQDSADTALRLEKNMAGLFADGHWLRDRVARHLVSFYEARYLGRPQQEIRRCRGSCEGQQQAEACEDAATLHVRGWRKLEEGRPLEALADLELAIKLDPTCAAAYNQRGIVRRILALEDFNMADKLTRDDPTVHGQLRELCGRRPGRRQTASRRPKMPTSSF